MLKKTDLLKKSRRPQLVKSLSLFKDESCICLSLVDLEVLFALENEASPEQKVLGEEILVFWSDSEHQLIDFLVKSGELDFNALLDQLFINIRHVLGK